MAGESGFAGGVAVLVVILVAAGAFDALVARRKLARHHDDIGALDADEGDAVPTMAIDEDAPLGATRAVLARHGVGKRRDMFLEVPQPSVPPTPVVPNAPVTPAVPDPGTPAHPQEPATVPVPQEPPTPTTPDPEPAPESPNEQAADAPVWR